MYLSTVMKVLSSRGSCTYRSHPHFSHASAIHWTGSEVAIMPASSQPAAAYPFDRAGQIIFDRAGQIIFDRAGQIIWTRVCISLRGSSSRWAVTTSMPQVFRERTTLP
jgi:hypothetical protein